MAFLSLSFLLHLIAPRSWPRQTAQQLAERSVATGQTISSGDELTTFTSQAISWLTRLGVVQNGHVSDMFVTLKTVLEEPSVRASCDSRISIRRHLEGEGWQQSSGRESSILRKRYNVDAPLEYFFLLKQHLPAITQYDDKYNFRHSQGKAYYECLLCCFSRADSDSRFKFVFSIL